MPANRELRLVGETHTILQRIETGNGAPTAAAAKEKGAGGSASLPIHHGNARLRFLWMSRTLPIGPSGRG